MHETTLLTLDTNDELKLDAKDSLILNSFLTSPERTIEIASKAYVDSLSENNGSRRFISTMLNDQDI